MKISTFCLVCAFEPKNDLEKIKIESQISIEENDLYHFICAKGHDNLLELQALKFELLYESGLCAIKAHYYLESVLSLTASLERFYEFFLKIILSVNNVMASDIDSTYKMMSRQSERQMGAFLALFVMTYKKLPPTLNQKSVEFRNNVVHKGYFPNRDEVLAYAKEIFNLIKSLYILLRKDFEKQITDQIFKEKDDRRKKNKILLEKIKTNISSISPVLSLTHISELSLFEKITFEECFDQVMRTEFYS